MRTKNFMDVDFCSLVSFLAAKTPVKYKLNANYSIRSSQSSLKSDSHFDNSFVDLFLCFSLIRIAPVLCS